MPIPAQWSDAAGRAATVRARSSAGGWRWAAADEEGKPADMDHLGKFVGE
jgi:hypothetical protein